MEESAEVSLFPSDEVTGQAWQTAAMETWADANKGDVSLSIEGSGTCFGN